MGALRTRALLRACERRSGQQWCIYSDMRLWLSVFIALPLLAQETILLRPHDKLDPSAPAEKIEERGKGGVVDRSISNVLQPTVTVYLPVREKVNGTGIVICPGGGYQHLAIDKEGHDIARWLNTIGIAGIVLKYRLPGSMRGDSQTDIHQVADRIHVALEDAESAMRLARENAAKWHLKPDAIGMMGFSAGGHLAAMMGMVAPADLRPDFLVLGYPAIPAVLAVTASTPRTFLVAADDDPLVNPADNAGRFFAALRAVNVPAELHIYSSGGHGFGMLKTGKTSAAWPDALVAWLKEIQSK
jgi:acetyl esterase/lipase